MREKKEIQSLLKKLHKERWAKHDGTTIREHTKKLLENLRNLKKHYRKEIEELKALYDENFNMIAYAFLIGLNCEVRSREGQANDEGEEGNSEPA